LFSATQILRADGFVSPRFLSSSRQIGICLIVFGNPFLCPRKQCFGH